MDAAQENQNESGEQPSPQTGAQETLHNLKQTFSDAAQEVGKEAREALEPVTEKAMNAAEKQKEAGADQMQSVARAIHGAADQLQGDMPQAAEHVHNAAQGLERASNALRERSFEDLATGLRDFARKDPAIFIGSSLLAGFVLARFLKSSASSAAGDRSESDSNAQPAGA
jgi:hypothetical protein